MFCPEMCSGSDVLWNDAGYNYLQTLGVEELPADWDDFYALMLRAKEQDPESIPFTTFEGHYTYSISPVAGSYGIATDAGYQWLAQNGQANWAFSTDEYLYTLQTLNSMVDDGLIQESPDYPNSIIHSYEFRAGGRYWLDCKRTVERTYYKR